MLTKKKIIRVNLIVLLEAWAKTEIVVVMPSIFFNS